MSASRRVMATPTLDTAADVTWPAWERPARVLTHLLGEKTSHNTKNGRRLLVRWPGNIPAAWAKPGCKAINRPPIPSELGNPITCSVKVIALQHVSTGAKTTESKYAKQMKAAHMSEWPMSSRVAEAVRYLKEEHIRGGGWSRCHSGPSCCYVTERENVPKDDTHGPELWTSCQPLDRFCLRWLKGPKPSCLLMSVAFFSLTSRTCRKVWISSSICATWQQADEADLTVFPSLRAASPSQVRSAGDPPPGHSGPRASTHLLPSRWWSCRAMKPRQNLEMLEITVPEQEHWHKQCGRVSNLFYFQQLCTTTNKTNIFYTS